MGQPDRRDQWLDTRNPDELIELQHAVGRALESANKRMNAENVKKRKLSKRVRSPSADAIALSHHHAKMGSLSSLALQAGVIQTPNGEQA
ncbi:hypothetical protein FRC19_006468 [Serendipita sp. 401]|nr:hypothetical protein FRC19_006468 [Serendipita sp. 401]KAG8869919.1 hypothetical protein FRC20_000657 [Serendipita sp. 405]